MLAQIANRYEIISLVGQGGMADVYKAKDVILNRIVAIKVLRSKLSDDPMTLVRFQREASAASRLSHPNVVDIYDVGEYENMHYIVMEYIRGRTLKELITQRGSLDVDEAIGIMKQLVSAVLHAHEHNIIHRDIKPQNVLVKDDGTIKITDFGIAVANDSVQLTFNNTVMGSAHYLAPETTQGKEPNPQVDIYSLGIVFYELLTGQVPYKGKTPTEIAIKHLREPIPFVRDFNPAIPQSVENIVLKATAKHCEERYVSCKEMLYDLNHCLDREYINMKRLKLSTQEVSMVQYEKGHMKLVNDVKKTVVEEGSKHNWIAIGLVSLAIVIGLVLIFLFALISGVVRISGVFGYETMPDVVNMTQTKAIETLEDANFDTDQITFQEKVSDSIKEGKVSASNYKSGEVIKKDSKIVLTVSKGSSYLIRDFTDETYSKAVSELLEACPNLNIEVEYEGRKDTNPGVILEQSGLKAGTRIDPESDETITFVVSTYPSIVIPSDLIGKDVDDAKAELNALGIAVVTSQIENGSGTYIVVSVYPDVGSEYIQEGTDSVVTLYYD